MTADEAEVDERTTIEWINRYCFDTKESTTEDSQDTGFTYIHEREMSIHTHVYIAIDLGWKDTFLSIYMERSF